MRKSVKVIFVFLLSLNLFTSGQASAQDTTYFKNQWSIGLDPTLWSRNNKNYWTELNYRRFVNKKLFYKISLVSRIHNKTTDTSEFYNYLFIPAASIGYSLPFFKICRFNAAVSTSVFLERSKSKYDVNPDGHYNRTGVFIGPDFGLEIVPIKTKKMAVSLFGNMRLGPGFMHIDSYYHSTSKIFDDIIKDETIFEAYGTFAVGISISY